MAGSFEIPTRIGVYIVDPIYGKVSDEVTEPEVMEREFGVPFEHTDIAPGFSFPALVTWIATDGWPIVAAGVALFLSGDKILKNLDAWPELARRLKGFVYKGRKPVFDRTGAAVVAVNAVLEQTNPASVRLLGYRSRRTFDEPPGDAETIVGTIEKEPQENYLGIITHEFVVRTSSKTFLVAVGDDGEIVVNEIAGPYASDDHR